TENQREVGADTPARRPRGRTHLDLLLARSAVLGGTPADPGGAARLVVGLEQDRPVYAADRDARRLVDDLSWRAYPRIWLALPPGTGALRSGTAGATPAARRRVGLRAGGALRARGRREQRCLPLWLLHRRRRRHALHVLRRRRQLHWP